MDETDVVELQAKADDLQHALDERQRERAQLIAQVADRDQLIAQLKVSLASAQADADKLAALRGHARTARDALDAVLAP